MGKHQFGEAFMLMKYRSVDGEEETLWNSRDGISPFIVPSRTGKEMRHVDWPGDVYAPKHKPKSGDRIFVRLTEERALEIAKRRVESLWSQYPREDLTKEELVAELVKNLVEDFGGDSPDILTVGAEA